MNIERLKQLTTETSDYTKAYANYRLGIATNLTGNKQQAQKILSIAANELVQLNSTQANAENYALLSVVYGMKIYIDSSLSSNLGIKAGKALNQAISLEPNNPRVQLVQGINSFYKPQKSIQYINASLNNFKQDCDHICWGNSEAYIWKGLINQSVGEIAEAQSNWKQALAVNPNNGWAKGLLKN